MLLLQFRGWFEVRLATDPDPHDEPRGVSGYMRALPGEPDFDRIIRFQAASVVRSYGPATGVAVDMVANANGPVAAHPLFGAQVELEDGAVFEGRNEVVAADGGEPIVPFHFAMRKEGFLLRRKPVAEVEQFPFDALRSTAVVSLPPVAIATGIYDQRGRLDERASIL